MPKWVYYTILCCDSDGTVTILISIHEVNLSIECLLNSNLFGFSYQLAIFSFQVQKTFIFAVYLNSGATFSDP